MTRDVFPPYRVRALDLLALQGIQGTRRGANLNCTREWARLAACSSESLSAIPPKYLSRQALLKEREGSATAIATASGTLAWHTSS